MMMQSINAFFKSSGGDKQARILSRDALIMYLCACDRAIEGDSSMEPNLEA